MASPVVETWAAAVEAARGSIPAAFLLGLVERLSGGDPNKIGVAGARGLMQIHPDSASDFGVTADQLLDPEVNLATGAQLIELRGAQLAEADPALAAVDRGEDLGRLTLAAYWFGPGGILGAMQAIGQGATAAQLLGQPGLEQQAAFVGDLEGRVRRIEAELAGEAPPADAVGPDEPPPLTGPGNGEPPTDLVLEPVEEAPRISGRSILMIVGLAGAAIGTFLLLRDRD